MNKAYIGIDPGKNGFLTVINQKGYFEFYPIPLVGKELDILKINDIISSIISEESDFHCVIEDVHALYGASAGSTFIFGYVCGVLEGILVANNIPYTKVAPKKWQKQMWEGIPLQQKSSSTGKTMVTDTKLMSLMAAKRLFPKVDLRETERCKKPHDGKVDSLLIAEYCRRNFK